MDADGFPPSNLADQPATSTILLPPLLSSSTRPPSPSSPAPFPNPNCSSHMDHTPRSGGGGSGGGRDDCWSEGGTGALVEAWGERYEELSRGNLRQKDWKEVAATVNEHLEAAGKPLKTDIQCKNRIDTLKKKYKLEKAKPGPSQWPFFSRLDDLVGPGVSDGATKKAPNPAAAAAAVKSQRHPLSFTFKHRPLGNAKSNPNPNPNRSLCSDGSSSGSKVNSSPVSSESSRGDSGGGVVKSDGDGGEEEEGDGLLCGGKVGFGRRRQWGSSLDVGRVVGGGGGGMEGAFVELARAIVKFGEVYERVEGSKQQQMLELERQRMEFAKELEFQRMQIFMEAQLELEKMKRPKYAAGSGKRS